MSIQVIAHITDYLINIIQLLRNLCQLSAMDNVLLKDTFITILHVVIVVELFHFSQMNSVGYNRWACIRQKIIEFVDGLIDVTRFGHVWATHQEFTVQFILVLLN
jgi:hypothetical protein